METSNEEEEILEKLWVELVEKDKKTINRKGIVNEQLLNGLEKSGYVFISDGKIGLTDKGHDCARKIIRRHRLAERLFYDVLELGKDKIEKPSCEFEHVLSKEVEESICALLGHPRECPHGKSIPEGECCKKNLEVIKKVVYKVSDLKKKDSGKIAYILMQDDKKLQKLMALGVLPGKSVIIVQNFPAYVLQIGSTQIVIDREMADAIFLRITK